MTETYPFPVLQSLVNARNSLAVEAGEMWEHLVEIGADGNMAIFCLEHLPFGGTKPRREVGLPEFLTDLARALADAGGDEGFAGRLASALHPGPRESEASSEFRSAAAAPASEVVESPVDAALAWCAADEQGDPVRLSLKLADGSSAAGAVVLEPGGRVVGLDVTTDEPTWVLKSAVVAARLL